MGCGDIYENQRNDKSMHQSTISLTFDANKEMTDLKSAQNIINTITSLRNRIIYLYHRLIYKSGACCFLHSDIKLIIRCIFFKISAEYQGRLELFKTKSSEDPPYIIYDEEKISKESVELLRELTDFIVELRSYKSLFKQIDGQIPELLYILYEYKEKISKENERKINEGVELFKELVRTHTSILNKYKEEIGKYLTRKEFYCQMMDAIGLEAYNKGITDIYEIVMLNKNNRKYEMFNDINKAKSILEEIISKETSEVKE